jgi:hypothetical protein
MRLKTVLLATTVIGGMALIAHSGQAANWSGAMGASGVCPNILGDSGPQGPTSGSAADCNLFINFNANGSISTTGPGGNYESNEDALIGVRNNTSHTIFSFNITGSGIFGFDGDGIDTYIDNVLTLPNAMDTSNGGYGGPDGYFTNIVGNTGTVNFIGGIAPGGSDFFSLEEPINISAPPIITPTPEPASMAVLGAGLLGFGLLRRRKSKG